MKLFSLALVSALCMVSQAISISSFATLSLTLASLNAPVFGFFGIFRRRSSPIQETVATQRPQTSYIPGRQAPGPLFQPYGGFGGSGFFFPGFNTPFFGMFGQNRFPPQFRPPQQMKLPQQLQRPQPPFPVAPMQQTFLPERPNQPSVVAQFQSQHVPEAADFDINSIRDPRGEDDVPGMNTEEAESFFTLLAETDESKCISRLVCEMGANPESGGEFGQTIVEIIGSLNDFPDGSRVSEYNEVLSIGLSEGLSGCMSKFSACDEESYELVKKAQVDDEGQS